MPWDPRAEPYISVDVERAGPYPARYSLLSIGACTVADPYGETFYTGLKPLSREFVPEAPAVSGLSPERLVQIFSKK